VAWGRIRAFRTDLARGMGAACSGQMAGGWRKALAVARALVGTSPSPHRPLIKSSHQKEVGGRGVPELEKTPNWEWGAPSPSERPWKGYVALEGTRDGTNEEAIDIKEGASDGGPLAGISHRPSKGLGVVSKGREGGKSVNVRRVSGNTCVVKLWQNSGPVFGTHVISFGKCKRKIWRKKLGGRRASWKARAFVGRGNPTQDLSYNENLYS